MVHLPLQPPSFLPDFDALPPDVTAALPRCRALLLNYPNNPTAATADEEFWSRALAFARAHDLLLIHDNPYALQVRGGPHGWGG
jgi:aspartate/methionine/tyrosine aminotransferase